MRVLGSPVTSVCHNHPDTEPEYACRMCGAVFCNACPRIVRRTPLCPLCGDLCRDYRAVTEKRVRVELQRSAFGMDDLSRAIRYPLQHKTALLIGALVYAFLLLGGFSFTISAWALMFGCISHIISQVAWGRFDRGFMPDFSEFSDWDDVFAPLFLGLGIMIIAWGPVIVLVIALLSGVVNGAPLDTEPADPVVLVLSLLPFVGEGKPVGFLILLFSGWGVFYYPMALTVAGYTQSLESVINPLVGLDTIRRMRSTYFKAFAMVLAVQLIALGVGATPFAVPFMGNWFGTFINATLTFYFNLVIACILGLSLFKCADRLDIIID